MTFADIKQRISDENVRYLRLQFTDMLGDIKAVEVPVERLDDALHNRIMFDGSSIEGFVRIKEADMYLHPDLDSFLILPFEESRFGKVARFLCDVYKPNGEPFEGDPRGILKRQIAKMKSFGIDALNVGFEPEFYLFKLDANGKCDLEFADKASYFDLSPFDGGEEVRRDITLTLQEMGYPVQASHHEVGPGQNEITFRFADVLTSCDRVQTFKQVVQVVARKHNCLATFMPKPVEGRAGNGMHTNCSLFSKEKGNLFYDEKDPMGLSLLAKKWMSGLIKHARELALLTNPSVNSYKRLVSGFEAPIYACWSDANRSSLIRVPAVRGASTRAEMRNVDPFANPYLALAGILAAGLDGIGNLQDEEIVGPVYDNIFELNDDEIDALGIERLPETLHSAIQAYKKSALIQEVLGPHTFDKYLEAKQKEWKLYHNSVSSWELEHYLGR